MTKTQPAPSPSPSTTQPAQGKKAGPTPTIATARMPYIGEPVQYVDFSRNGRVRAARVLSVGVTRPGWVHVIVSPDQASGDREMSEFMRHVPFSRELAKEQQQTEYCRFLSGSVPPTFGEERAQAEKSGS